MTRLRDKRCHKPDVVVVVAVVAADILDLVYRAGTQERHTQGSLDRREYTGQVCVEPRQRLRLDVHTVERHDLVVRLDLSVPHDSAPVDRQNLIVAAFRRCWTCNPDLPAGDRRQTTNERDRVENRLITGVRQTRDLLARTGKVGDDVVELAIVRVHIHSHFWPIQVLRQVCFDGLLHLGQTQTSNIYTAVRTQADRPIRTDDVLPGNLLYATGLRQRHCDDGFRGELPNFRLNHFLRLIGRQIGHPDRATVARTQVDGAIGINRIEANDLGPLKVVLRAQIEHVERFESIRRQWDDADGINLKHIRRLDDVRRQTHLVQLFGDRNIRNGAAIEIRRLTASSLSFQILHVGATDTGRTGPHGCGDQYWVPEAPARHGFSPCPYPEDYANLADGRNRSGNPVHPCYAD